MASTSSSSNSIAAELLSNITMYGYKEMVPFINECDAISLDKTTKLAQVFRVDTSRAYKNGRVNPSHLFEIFGNFSGHDAVEVCELLLEHMKLLTKTINLKTFTLNLSQQGLQEKHQWMLRKLRMTKTQ